MTETSGAVTETSQAPPQVPDPGALAAFAARYGYSPAQAATAFGLTSVSERARWAAVAEASPAVAELRRLARDHDDFLGEVTRNSGTEPEPGETPEDTALRYVRGLEAELAKVQGAARTLGMVVTHQARDLYAAWIDVSRGDLQAVRERVLNSVPDCDDNGPGGQWNGTEAGDEWFERTRETS